MIDEKKLIYWIKCHCNPYGKPDLGFDTSVKIMEFIENQMEKVGEWIPCSEKLPIEEWETYITTHEDGSVQIHSYTHKDGFVFNWNTDKPNSKVVAWMPLPEPYKPEGE